MNTHADSVAGLPSKKTQNLSRFHPRSPGRPEDALPASDDRKKREGWVHTPCGLRPSRKAQQAAEDPLKSIPKAAAQAEPADILNGPVQTEDLKKLETASVSIPDWVLQETSWVIKVGVAAFFLLGIFIAFRTGESHGRKIAAKEGNAAMVPPVAPSSPQQPALPAIAFPEELLPEFDAALGLLRRGENLDALNRLNALLKAHPGVPSLHYAAALAALQAGYPREAERLADASIANGFRVSDSWALKAAITASTSGTRMPERETLLKKAIAADPMNPSPYVELAAFHRARNEPAEASKLLDAAALRFNPTDAQSVVETTKAILAVDSEELIAETPQPLGIASKDLPAAYAEMKRGNFDSAAAILRYCRSLTDPDLFDYLVNDPSLRKFASRPEFKEFY